MDILKPQLVWIGNRCYRKNTLKESSGYNPEDEEMWEEEQAPGVMYCDEVCDISLNIEETNKGFRLKVPVPRAFYKFIIGKMGETKKRLETETRTQVFVPKPGDREEIISITGQEKKGVISAKTRIDVIVDSARQHQQFTHFLSVPVTADNIVSSFDSFKQDVLLHCDGDAGLDASIFQNPHKLHLTIATLVLLNSAEIQKAVNLLESCRDDLISPIVKDRGLTVEIEGLEYMNDDPSSVDVLYAKVKPGEEADRLQMLADRLMDKFVSAGLAQREYDRVKLHATVMNTLFRRAPADADTGKVPPKAPREAFDASGVLTNFGGYNFGQLTIGSVHLSQRFSTGRDQYYECEAQAKVS